MCVCVCILTQINYNIQIFHTAESTFWYDVKGSYLGAYMNEGFYGDMLFQLAEELRDKFPLVFKDYPLRGVC